MIHLASSIVLLVVSNISTCFACVFQKVVTYGCVQIMIRTAYDLRQDKWIIKAIGVRNRSLWLLLMLAAFRKSKSGISNGFSKWRGKDRMQQRVVLVVNKRNVTKEFKTYTQLWQIFMWPIKEEENRHLLILWPNRNPYSKLQECVVTVLLLTSTPVGCSKMLHGTATGKKRPLLSERFTTKASDLQYEKQGFYFSIPAEFSLVLQEEYQLIVRNSNHVLYISNVSRLARPNFFSVCARKEKKVWPSQPGYVTNI